ncbi:MerR family transcriptional regulator [Chitinolyticbacter albus]|uniref:MerR family transcriptional regulator n=1 Tax=Chitinolyticbacter albus TaxID=2961951 RepID=UPI00210E7A25|nr:MerR family transcriptional regulator [Chitinolyticbacter albus]
MSSSIRFLNASEAAKRLGVSAKALRLYEQHGLVTPSRTMAGYRAYSPEDVARAAEVVALRQLGLSLAQTGLALDGDMRSLETALLHHEAALNRDIQSILEKLDKVRDLRAGIASGKMPAQGDLNHLLDRAAAPAVALTLPWPWGGEWFELPDIRPINYIIGSLGSGKTRLAWQLAQAIPGAAFVGLDRRLAPDDMPTRPAEAEACMRERAASVLNWLLEEGATNSDALIALLACLSAKGPTALVIDLVEQGLDQATQEALATHLRHRAREGARPLFLITRSSALLDLAMVGSDEAIILCPANHSPPSRVAPLPGAMGYEAVATCLASPAVRARIAHPPAPGAEALATGRPGPR